jgi:hypothetical protein
MSCLDTTRPSISREVIHKINSNKHLRNRSHVRAWAATALPTAEEYDKMSDYPAIRYEEPKKERKVPLVRFCGANL